MEGQPPCHAAGVGAVDACRSRALSSTLDATDDAVMATVVFWVSVVYWAITWGLAAALVAQRMNREAVGPFLLGALLGPMGVLIVALTPQPRSAGEAPPPASGRSRFVRCGACGRETRSKDKVCPYCSTALVQESDLRVWD
jgi:hypothetical protein